MKKEKTATEIWRDILVFVANRDSLAELESNETLDTGQPGGSIRRLLRYFRDTRIEFPGQAPITRITREREGD